MILPRDKCPQFGVALGQWYHLITGLYALFDQILPSIISIVATLLTGKGRLPIVRPFVMRSLFHSIKPIMKLADGSFLMKRHVTDVMRIEGVCICLMSLPLSSISICPESMSFVSREYQHWSHSAFLQGLHLHQLRRCLLRIEGVRSASRQLQS
jgi:hypothetical protein